MPEAFGPRNEGQLPLFVSGLARDGGFALEVVVILRGGLVTTSVEGIQVLPPRIILRGKHSSETRSNLMRCPSVSKRYLPGPSQPPGPPLITNSTSGPAIFQLPLILGQRSPSIESVPAGSKRA